MMLWERGPGMTTRHVHTQASPLAGTSYITLEDFKCPVANMIGKVNEGFKVRAAFALLGVPRGLTLFPYMTRLPSGVNLLSYLFTTRTFSLNRLSW